MNKLNFSYASKLEHNFAQRLIIKTIENNSLLIKKENVKWEGWDSEYQWCFPLTGGPFLNHQPNRNIRIN